MGRRTLQNVARLHEETVQAAVSNRLVLPEETAEDSEYFPVQHIQVDAAVLKEALKSAGGDPRRLRIQHDGSIIVANKPVRRLEYTGEFMPDWDRECSA